jgi:hypothetical protein
MSLPYKDEKLLIRTSWKILICKKLVTPVTIPVNDVITM